MNGWVKQCWIRPFLSTVIDLNKCQNCDYSVVLLTRKKHVTVRVMLSLLYKGSQCIVKGENAVIVQWEFRSPISSQLYIEKYVLVTINLEYHK